MAVSLKHGSIPIGGMATALPNPDADVNRAAGESIKRDQETAQAAGKPAPTCVPKGSKLGQSELLNYFEKMPAAQQRALSVKQGMVGLIRQKWPCR